MAIHNIPTTFRLGGRGWIIVFKDSIENGEIFARWLDNKAEIQIAYKAKDDGELVDCDEYQLEHSFWHELGHIIQYYSTGTTDDTFAQTFATFIMEYNQFKVLR